MPVRDMTMLDGPRDLAGIAISALDARLGLRLEARKFRSTF
jgi:hypothetical protein